MPRNKRIHYRHAFYHVMLRGNNRQNIFFDDKDRHSFYPILEHATKSFRCKIHLFCLMSNHIHLVIEVGDIPLSKIMQCISGSYARKHNKRHSWVGHLFQGRYKAKLIEDDLYLLELCYYIHMNPVKAGIVNSIESYPWSSHHTYANTQKISWVTTSRIYEILSRKEESSSNPYNAFITNRKSYIIEPIFCTLNSSGEFIYINEKPIKATSKPFLSLENVSINQIIRIVCQHLDLPIGELSSKSKKIKVSLARSMVTYFAHYHAKYTLKEIAGIFCQKPDSLSKNLKRHMEKANYDEKIAHVMEALEGKLSVSDLDKLNQ